MSWRQTAAQLHVRGLTPLLTLLVLCAFTALATDRFLSPLNLTNILVQSSIMAVIALGMTFVIIGGGFDLSVGSTVALSGCIAALVMVKAGLVLGIVAGIAAGVLVGLLNVAVIVFGVHTPLRLDLLAPVVYGLIALVVVLAGAALPAWRTTRLQVVEALQYE